MNSLSKILLLGLLLFLDVAVRAEEVVLHTRKQVKEGSEWQVREAEAKIDPKKTAIIVCDMWDKHWCKGATARVGEIAPRMNEMLKAARAKGVLIIHAPSDTMDFYKDFAQRKKAMAAPYSEAPADIGKWKSLNQDKEGPLPIDDSDGGCDDFPQCANYKAWKKQIDVLEIQDADYISDKGNEVYNILQQHGIENVIILGVHTNMCVLGRPFSIRQMVSLGKNTYLVRDMTDTMYNSRKSPFVSHFVGTDLVVGHIEKHWCPTITSVDFVGGKPFRFKDDQRKTVALIIGENEYKTWETLPEFAAKELKSQGINYELVTSSTNTSDQEFKKIEAIKGADLLLVSVRRRTPPKEMMEYIRAHLNAGKPLVGIRTASHAFALRERDRAKVDRERYADWNEFDPEVLGGNYKGHHGNDRPKIALMLAPGAEGHPILKGVDLGGLRTHGSLYIVSPLKAGTTPLITGTFEQFPTEPVAWTHEYGPKHARIFYTSMGHPDDFKNEEFRDLLRNAVLWALNDPSRP